MKSIFTIGYYCLHIILFGPNLIIRLRFDVLPTREISVIFLYISVGNETPNQSLLKLIMKMGLIANWYDYINNLMCCFSCFILYACFCWGWINRGMWCYCFTKERISICNWWLRRRPDLFLKWWCLFRKFSDERVLNLMKSKFLHLMKYKIWIWPQRKKTGSRRAEKIKSRTITMENKWM